VSALAKELSATGACVVRRVVSDDNVAALAADFDAGRAAGVGFRGVEAGSVTACLLAEEGALGRLAAALSGRAMRPVRTVRFDKTSAANWMVPWHQDRTIAVAGRHDVDGFGPWSVKRGVVHVEPPVALLEGMLTLRLFVDACGEDQGPIEIALSSHRMGRVPADRVAEAAKKSPKLVAVGAPGDVLAMHPLALHMSARSQSDARRRVLHVDYASAELPPPLQWAMG
jgi:hypothetical protein